MSQSLDTKAITPHPRRLSEYSNNFTFFVPWVLFVLAFAGLLVWGSRPALAELDSCEESLRRWGTRAPGCPKPNAGDRWSADQLDNVENAFDELRAEDALLWIDEQGNIGLTIPVERVVFFDGGGHPIGRTSGDSERCRRSVASSMRPTAVLCLRNDDLRRLVGPE